MIDIKNKGLLNEFTSFDIDPRNKTNKDNHRIFSNVLMGLDNTPMFSYLRNLNTIYFQDLKSMTEYNNTNYASLKSEVMPLSEINDLNTLSLPRPARKIRRSISSLLNARKSVREFSGRIISLKDFSTILHFAFGVSKRITSYGETKSYGRYFPSGGGLYPIDAVVFENKVEDIPAGFYKYQPYSHTLQKLNTKSYQQSKFFAGGIDIKNLNFAIFYIYTINKTYLKYGELSLANSLIEVGCMAENFDLVTKAYGLGSCDVAGIDKQYLENLLYIDGVNQVLVLSSICGDEK